MIEVDPTLTTNDLQWRTGQIGITLDPGSPADIYRVSYNRGTLTWPGVPSSFTFAYSIEIVSSSNTFSDVSLGVDVSNQQLGLTATKQTASGNYGANGGTVINTLTVTRSVVSDPGGAGPAVLPASITKELSGNNLPISLN